MKNDQLPSYNEDNYLGEKGIRLVDLIVSDELRWIFRDVRKADIGIDGQIEVVDEKQRGTGRLLAVQIKCGTSYLSEASDEGYTYRGDRKHLKYWLEHSLPVILVVCDPQKERCYWQVVTGANTNPLENTWTMVIPKSNLLGVTSKDQLQTIAGHPQHKDIIELLLYRFLREKYRRNIEICTILELPRDYHKYAYLAKLKDKVVMIDFHYDMYGRVTVEDIDEIVRWKEYNNRVCGPNPLHIYIVSESRNALNLSPGVVEYFKSQNDIHYYRLLYSRVPFFELYELDNDGEVVTIWPED